MIVFSVGLALMALVIGFMSGISGSPIVNTLLPLLFALATAGGNIYVIWGKETKEKNFSRIEKIKRAKFVGMQLILFVLLFLPGLWFGVFTKFNPDIFWPQNNDITVYQEFIDGDPSVMSLLRDFDYMLINDAINIGNRKKIIFSLYQNRENWKNKEIPQPLTKRDDHNFNPRIVPIPFWGSLPIPRP